MITHVCFFFAIVLGTVFFSATKAYAAGADDVTMKMAGSIGQGLGFIAAALATGLSALGAGIAVAAAAPAAIGAFSENEKNFGKSMIDLVSACRSRLFLARCSTSLAKEAYAKAPSLFFSNVNILCPTLDASLMATLLGILF